MQYDTDIDACSTTLIALPMASGNVPGCVFKTCCKKYKKGKRCKSCPKK
ncbi:hypothetical protein ACAW74_26990 [Fibrella sp. WM1]